MSVGIALELGQPITGIRRESTGDGSFCTRKQVCATRPDAGPPIASREANFRRAATRLVESAISQYTCLRMHYRLEVSRFDSLERVLRDNSY